MATKTTEATKEIVTLAIDTGGTGIKMMALDSTGKSLTERVRVPTPTPATTTAVLAEFDKLKAQMPAFDRVSVGFPGVIKHGKTFTAANLDPSWLGFPLQETLEKQWKKPVRVCNDAAVQGYAAVQGKDVELILTLGNRPRIGALYQRPSLSRPGTCPPYLAQERPHLRGLSRQARLTRNMAPRNGIRW